MLSVFGFYHMKIPLQWFYESTLTFVAVAGAAPWCFTYLFTGFPVYVCIYVCGGGWVGVRMCALFDLILGVYFVRTYLL